MVGKRKYVFKINLARFLFFFNIVTRKLKIIRMAPICMSHFISVGNTALDFVVIFLGSYLILSYLSFHHLP